MDTQNNETITSLQNHLAHLKNLVERVNTLRKIPGLLLAPSILTGSQLEQGFEQINDLKNDVGGPTTQDCLKLARESFSKNSENIGMEARRESRKRRRPPSPIPDSPRPPPALPKRIFPLSLRSSPLTVSELPSYLREHNKTEKTVKLHIWSPTKPSPRKDTLKVGASSQSRDVIVRISIQDVLYAYVRLDVEGITDHRNVQMEPDRMDEDLPAEKLVVESVTVFGPRERKSPHSQSDFMMFQKLSQHVAWMIQAEPDVELQSLVALFCSYETLFVSHCIVCHRILSEEGHFPPVCRIWTPLRRTRDTKTQDKESAVPIDENDGKWESTHRTCLMG